MRKLTSVLEEKKQVDERAKHVGLEVLSEWVEEQLALSVTGGGVMTRESVQRSEPMSAELRTSLSQALVMDNEAIARQATAILRYRLMSSHGVSVPNLVRFGTYAMSWPISIKLQYKH